MCILRLLVCFAFLVLDHLVSIRAFIERSIDQTRSNSVGRHRARSALVERRGIQHTPG